MDFLSRPNSAQHSFTLMNNSQHELSAIDREYHRIILGYCKGNQDITLQLKSVLGKLSDQLISPYVKGLSKEDKKRLGNLCELLIKLYQDCKAGDKEKQHALTLNEKALWLSSKANGRYYYPYYEQIGSFDHMESVGNLALVDIRDIKGAFELCQGTFPTCSFVCALQSLIYYMNPDQFVSSLIQNCSGGTFLVVFYFNGTRRSCIVDSSTSIGQVGSITNPNLKWPALIEKAFLQIYNCQVPQLFSGSNFANDCYLLSGFVPEYISINKLTEEKMNQIFDAYVNKHTALVALGTGELSLDAMKQTHLLPFHDYIVEKLEKNNHNYTFTLRNPSKPKIHAFTYAFSKVCRFFQTLYMNWNTDKLFRFKTNVVFVGSHNHKFNNESCIENPQFVVKANPHGSKRETWILVEEHLKKDTDKTLDSKIQSIRWFEGDKWVWGPNSGLLIATFNSNGTRFILSKVWLPKTGSLTGVIEIKRDLGDSFVYSVNCYSDFPAFLSRPIRDAFSVQFDSLWTMTESGGNWTKDTYLNNPQFEVFCDEGTFVVNCTIGIFTQKDIHINAAIFDNDFSEFKCLASFDERLLVAGQPTEYRPGYEIFSVSLQPRKSYVIVCSTYDSNTLEEFRLRVKCDHHLTVKRISTSLGVFEERKKRTLSELQNDSWNNAYCFMLRRSSKVALKVRFSTYIREIQLINKDTMKTMFDEINVKHKTVFLGSQKHSIPSGTYVLRVKAQNSKGSIEIGATLGTDYRVELLPMD